MDGDQDNEEYSANIMVFQHIDSSLDLDSRKSLKRRMEPFGRDVAFSSLEGYLELLPDLSARADDEEAAPDPHLSAIVLPIPRARWSNDHGFRLLPGAPLAWHQKEMFVCTDTEELPKWCRDHDFSPGNISAFEQYLAKQRPFFRSFLSLPLFYPDEQGGDNTAEDPVGILNIQRRSPGLLAGRYPSLAERPSEDQQAFRHFARPYIFFLVRLLLGYLDGAELKGRS